ncbi:MULTISPECIES: hypothetical protein [Xanthomonas]|uniref:Transposase n=1 Tax=Xanthomonas rydalmerensis TaxID=3046274 RepID=A0ABZ0JIX4_9XANT|nr:MULTISPECIES: hypothetical protein [unclassified Xanthomonas]MXV05636.1 hypothetical protein [Xanthomonas sp. LMG 9002]WOS39745.1 hypothetical protein QN243_15130 [Xanthomonas sp. DM-2023]WOS43929.1 hypothetical protein QN242_15130 [Xanthomonas sp. DM-2023]WOS48109.1 hypothetical protein QN240_15130 [Xanthomonas sp. DM-2023]WOS52288.1 hypothetical protein QN244_15130 [Xanthomonas sp. DM-2023]
MRQEDEEPVRRLLFFCGKQRRDAAAKRAWMALAILATARDILFAMLMRTACVDAANRAS